MKFFVTAIFFLFSICVKAQVNEIIPERPAKSEGLVIDYTNTLTGPQKEALNQKLIAYDDSTSSQVLVVIIKSLEDYDIAEYALALGRKWGVGESEFNNGVIVLISIGDRKSRIEVGYGLEGAIPDITAKNIIDNSLTPYFKQGNYYAGLDAATDDIIRAAAGEYKAPQGYAKKKGKGIPWGSVIFVIIFIGIAIAGGGGRGGGGGGTMSNAGWIIGSILSSGRSSGGGGGGSSGGFGGFGGGSFGGGGASGSW